MDGSAEMVFRNLNTYAQKTKGYSALDYDVLVHYNRQTDVLTIAEGRGKYMSAATKDRNEQGEAVCICGNYDLREPLAIEVEGVALGVVYGIKNGWILPTAKILGHRDNPAHPNATSCPGANMYSKLPVVRARVITLLNPPAAPIGPLPVGDDVKFCVHQPVEGDPNALFIYDHTSAVQIAWPGHELKLIAQLWDLEDQGVAFNSPRGKPGQADRMVPVPFTLNEWQQGTFENARKASS
ncbi:MAG: peptidoglycan-recognition protein SC2-like [Thermomicrobiales bacterium]|nr:peptidoglycan-recognition protein SC2-like [Thermomicrobiales bacterium]MDF3014825.1 peptidoglycan-recognition protein SC2-like [Thermomicrobiales bacterium]